MRWVYLEHLSCSGRTPCQVLSNPYFEEDSQGWQTFARSLSWEVHAGQCCPLSAASQEDTELY